jgi:GTP1/Obg family GTP-binding protein
MENCKVLSTTSKKRKGESRMNVRKKNAKEKEYDQAELDRARQVLADYAVNFVQEFAECDGDVFYSSYKDFSNKAWQYEREKENSAMPKVGDTWDYKNKICGVHRYRDI